MIVDIDVVGDFMYEHFENVSTTKNGSHWIARCLLCGDSKKNPRKKRFNLDYNNGNPIYNCFNCGASGSFVKLYSMINNISEKEAYHKLKKYDGVKIVKKINGSMSIDIERGTQIYNDVFYSSDTIGTNDLCTGYIDKKYQQILKDFIDNRKIPQNLDIRIAVSGRYKDRILIPIIEDDKVLYFQGRTIKKSDRKYLNPISDKNVILNRNEFDFDKYIIVTEGLLDAYTIGNQGTTCLGSYISDDFIRELRKYTKKGIIIAFDNDEPGLLARKKFVSESKFKNEVKFFSTPKKFQGADDINNIVRMYDVDNIYDIIVRNSFKYYYIKLKGVGGNCNEINEIGN